MRRLPPQPNALEMLADQHRAVADLFERLEDADDDDKPWRLAELADAITTHCTIEEKIFYPTVRASRTEDILLESLEEHLVIKRVLADIQRTSFDDPAFNAKVKVLKEQVEHHVEEEEGDLFPRVEQLFDEDQLEALAQEMTALAVDLQPGEALR